MTDREIVQHIVTWEEPPKGFPAKHPLYYREPSGWWWLTPQGLVIRERYGIKADQKALNQWAHKATESARAFIA